MRQQSAGTPGTRWRLVGGPAPTPGERVGRLAGLRVLRLPWSRRVFVLAGTLDRLRQAQAGPAATVPTTRLTVLVAWWRAPRPGFSAGVAALPHLIGQRVALPRLGRGPASVTLRSTRPAPLRDQLSAALGALGAGRPLPAPGSADLTGHAGLPGWLPAGPGTAVSAGGLTGRAEIRAHDLVLAPAPEPERTGDDEPPYALWWDTGDPVALLDARRVNPRGRRAAAYRADAPVMRLDLPAAARRTGGGRTYTGVLPGPGLDAAALAALRGTGEVRLGPLDGADPLPTATLLAQLAATGVLLRPAGPLPAPVADLLAGELRHLLTVPLPEDPLAREAHSVRQRRAALRGHATGLALPRLVAGTFGELARPPSVSAILVTRRPELLPAMVRTIAGQTYPELEIVVCVHAAPPPADLPALLAGCGRPFEVVTAGDRAGFGEVLAAATRAARGTLVTKFDDDDTYSSEHVWDLVLARHYSGATLVGRGTEFVHLEDLGVTVRRSSGVPEADGDVVAGGTMLLAKGDLEAVGGWRPVPRSVDLGLIERLRRDGAVIYRTHPLGYVYHRRPTGHTWDPGRDYFLRACTGRWDGIPADALAEPDGVPVG
jgi:hypothetical protein